VILLEKEQYPFHKVCGEYISLESWDFLHELGVDLTGMNVPIITKLQISSANGILLEQTLPLGGFGISRYKLDNVLVQIARDAGVDVRENTKVNDIIFSNDRFIIDTSSKQYQVRFAAGCFGKRSNLDIKWKRSFVSATKNRLNNYVGVKYHIHSNFPADTIALHNFKNGYCGIVKIDDEKYNLCYLSTADNLKKNNGDIKKMEQSILYQNPHLKKIMSECEYLFRSPLTISQISFDKKSLFENHVLMTGDAAGMITPLCGNGMSMALHGSKIAAAGIHDFLRSAISRQELEKKYTLQWNREFAHRMLTGRRIQRLFGSKWATNLLITLLRPFPKLVKLLVNKTHGKSF